MLQSKLALDNSNNFTMVVRTYEEELKYLERIDDNRWRIKKGFQPNMKVRSSAFFSCVATL